MSPPRSQMAGVDWLQLLVMLSIGGAAGYLSLQACVRLLLEPAIVEETALRLSSRVQLVEQVLEQVEPGALPKGVLVLGESRLAEARTDQLTRFDQLVHQAMAQKFRVERDLIRDKPPLQDAWGGHWVRLNHREGRSRDPLWLYQSERLSNTVWYLPLLRIMAIPIGVLAGLVVFLRLKVERPLSQLLLLLSERGASAPLPLLPESGITPVRMLNVHINRLLERINNTARARRELLQGLTHDLGGPHGRLMLRTEMLCDQLNGDQRQLALAMARDLEQLCSITEQLALLGEQELPQAERQTCSLDDLCGRVVASQPAGVVRLRVPRLLVHLNPEGLERALNNLIDNAIEHGAPPVSLSASRHGRDLVLRVDDQGAGIPTDTLLSMPRPSRSNDRQRQRYRGLGLAIVERFCLDHQGRLVLLKAPGGGLRAELRLPVVHEPAK